MSYNKKDSIDEPIIKVYNYGSSVYGTENENSDKDYIIVVEGDEEFDYNIDGVTNTNIIVYSKAKFIKLIEEHHISAMECIFQNDDDPFQEYFKLDHTKLRKAISSVASNSYGKCKKKLRDGEVYIAKKSLFHSLRILMYGQQIALFGKIIHYPCANYFYNWIMEMESTDWKDYQDRFQPNYNTHKTMFKHFAPMEGE